MERRQLYGGIIVLTGTVLAIVQVIHALQQSANPVVIAVDAVPMVAVALALAFAGSHLARDETYEPDLSRVLGWTAGGVVVFASFAALSLFGRNVATGDISRAAYVAIDNLTMGATAGVLVGLYDARGEQRLRELEGERDRIEQFAGKAADLSNYGRAIAQADDLSAVSAFSIEAVSTLLGFEETALLVVSGSEVTSIDSTFVSVDDGSLAALAEVATDGEVGSVVVHDEVPVDLDRTVGTLVTVHVARLDGSSAVFVSLTDEDDAVADEDRELLELLVSHAGMAIEGVESATATV